MSDPMQKMADPDGDRPMVSAIECEHLFVSEHRPGHLIYWVRQCCICHEVDWDGLDREVKKLVDKAVSRP
jgi:hypothetical protein